MCGIAGVLGFDTDSAVRDRMLQTMKRRGPDQSGSWSVPGCTILHARLSIIDPEGGKQPMEFIRGNEHYVITYNGELYNTSELRNILTKQGYHFMGHSDTEVLLLAYVHWGSEAVEHLNGIYAFAVWEMHNSRLYLARDRMGVKPLFYYHLGQRMVFGSEIKTVLASGVVRPRIDEAGVAELMLLGPGRTPGCGVFCDIQEVRPGCHGYFDRGQLLLKPYWQLTDGEFTDSISTAREKVRWLVTDAIQRQMVADVPIGAFLSGGLDSSIITAVCAQNAPERLKTFSVDYENNGLYFTPGKFQPDADGEYIQAMQEAFHTDHRTSVLTPEMLLEHLGSATDARDLPGMADVDFSLLAFCRDIRAQVKVALSGECADEIFGGYPWFRDPEVRLEDGFPWAQNTAYRASFIRWQPKRCTEYVMDRFYDTVNSADILPGVGPEDRRHKQLMALNIGWFMQTLLDRKDRMSMYWGLEVRVPFCDHRIAQYLYTVPWSVKDLNGREKGLLRTAMDGLLPPKVLWRKKSPYPKTYDPRYTSLVEERFKQLLTKDSPVHQLLHTDTLHSLLESEQRWPWYGQLMTRPQVLAYILQIDHWLQKYNVEII